MIYVQTCPQCKICSTVLYIQERYITSKMNLSLNCSSCTRHYTYVRYGL